MRTVFCGRHRDRCFAERGIDAGDTSIASRSFHRFVCHNVLISLLFQIIHVSFDNESKFIW